MAFLLERGDIIEVLVELARRLAARDKTVRIELIGGAAIALHTDRAATRDIDSVIYREDDVADVVAEIAAERNWPIGWINTSARLFMPDFPPDEQHWTTVIEIDRVHIVLAPVDLLLAMKMRAGRPIRDLPDIGRLVPLCDVDSLAAALAVFDRYFPFDEPNGRAQLFLAELLGA